MRSKMVNRTTLNDIAIKIGLKQLVMLNPNDAHLRKSQIYGNALEALIGAIYIDKGFTAAKKFILSRIIKVYMDVENMEKEESNLKNKLIGWANKNKKNIDFITLAENIEGKKKIFTIGVEIDGEIIADYKAVSKKEASKHAARLALEKLNLMDL
jgi:ribonuclease-3